MDQQDLRDLHVIEGCSDVQTSGAVLVQLVDLRMLPQQLRTNNFVSDAGRDMDGRKAVFVVRVDRCIVLQKAPDQVSLLVARCEVQRGAQLRVLRIDVSARLQQPCANRLSTSLRNEMQWRAAAFVQTLQARPSMHQQRHRWSLPENSGRMQGRAPSGNPEERGPGIEQTFADVEATLPSSNLQRCLPPSVHGVSLSLALQQQLSRLAVPGAGREVQRRAVVGLARAGLGARGQQRGAGGEVAEAGGLVEGGEASDVGLLRIGAPVEERLDGPVAPEVDGRVQRRPSILVLRPDVCTPAQQHSDEVHAGGDF
mmetsp:Transcript_23057/g.74443  ORF Transcript_23057/g.74443 Transcript_23057/m.74443 type:complete len:312 (-) Transcript_23057:557-1492(-)